MSVNATLASRHTTHGDFRDNGAIMQRLKETMRTHGVNWNVLPLEQKEALDMIQHKIGRILSGDNNFADHWHDIVGYAKLIENLVTKHD